MSFDFQLAHACPHLIMGEVVYISDDRQTMFLSGPVGSLESVRISVNGVFVPPEGYYSIASLTSARGPYRIENCVGTKGSDNELLTITTERGSVTVTLPVGPRVELAHVKKALVLGASSLVSCEETNGAITLKESNAKGAGSYVLVSGKGADSLGFLQRKSVGKLIYPPWQFLSRPNELPTLSATGAPQQNTARYPYFTKPVKGSPIIRVTYVTTPSQCPRCQGTLIENDYRFNALGDLLEVENEDLLYQVCLKAILTQKRSNPYHPAYGTAILSQIGRKMSSSVQVLIQEDISSILSQLQKMQAQQAKYQLVSLRERLYKVLSVQVSVSPTDPTLMFCDVVVSNMSNQPISLNIAFSVPGAVALAGSNGMSLGTTAVGL